MAKLAKQLKDGFFSLVERVKSCGSDNSRANGNKKVDISQLETSQVGGIQVASARGPSLPHVSKGPPPQTN